MAYALDSSKRKFHRLLESISFGGSSSSVSTPSKGSGPTDASSADAPPSKRVASGGSVNLSLFNGKNAKPSIIRLSNKSARQTSDSRKMLSFCPSDREQFLLRLQTFSKSIVDWSPKPDIINEVEWAKRGWFLGAKETVSCVGCSKRVVIDYKEEETEFEEDETLSYIEQERLREQARKSLAEKYAVLLSDGHYDHCPWKRRACDVTIYRIPTIHPATAIASLRSRYESLLKIHDKLPSNITFPEDLDLSMIYRKFLTRAYTPLIPHPTISAYEEGFRSEEDIKLTAFGLALLGWQADVSKQPYADIAHCGDCFRRLGLWMWRPRLSQDSSKSEALLDKLDATQQHRDYCPWSNATTQNEGTPRHDYEDHQLCGWEVLVRTIKNASMFSGDKTSPVDAAAPVSQPKATAAAAAAPAPSPSTINTAVGADRQDVAAKTFDEVSPTTIQEPTAHRRDESLTRRPVPQRPSTSPQRAPPPIPDFAMIKPAAEAAWAARPATGVSSEQDSTNNRPTTGRTGSGASSSTFSVVMEDKLVRDAKDKERISKLKKLKQVFTVKRRKKSVVVDVL